ncbi:unnamed protein product [Brachionus calyciflorus]|uniref:PID domain-containing protein n=1 Tax=Brachionus calyciflorus TaxID=104777 RepID=A0A814IYV0_9BILA|nr:unnamed protein product [Brachionus calyciflorus]
MEVSSRAKTSITSGQNYIAEDEVDRQPVDNLTPKPNRRMDKLRRSLTFRRKKKPNNELVSKTETALTTTTTTSATKPDTTTNSTSTNPNRPALWIEDEKRVRAGTCSFQVKYLGYQEVSDSRGMHICETALERLIADKDKKKSIKAILYITGDSLRVVDESNKTLLVDQTIEKVSFCAPDRHHENGFAYICRDGTARRWLCHGFLATKDTLKNASTGCTGGERLSHAVGCAFSVCLERKQKRERENVSMEVGPNHSFTRFGSFRQASLTERFDDPQMVIPKVDPVPIKQVDNPHAIERPKPSQDSFLTRQNSLRAQGGLNLPFKRGQPSYQSLKPGELPSFQQQKLGFKTEMLKKNFDKIPSSQTISELAELAKINEVPEQTNEVLSNQLTKDLSLTSPVNTIPIIPSVFTTPVSPISNSQVAPPPPLPPLPINYQSPMTNSAYSFFNNQQQMVYPSYTSPATITTTNTTNNNTETFEQKWARLQAAKNTNPFAEDIAKKYEIKL